MKYFLNPVQIQLAATTFLLWCKHVRHTCTLWCKTQGQVNSLKLYGATSVLPSKPHLPRLCQSFRAKPLFLVLLQLCKSPNAGGQAQARHKTEHMNILQDTDAQQPFPLYNVGTIFKMVLRFLYSCGDFSQIVGELRNRFKWIRVNNSNTLDKRCWCENFNCLINSMVLHVKKCCTMLQRLLFFVYSCTAALPVAEVN